METMPPLAQSYPPPPPPQRSRKGLWIGLTIGAVVLCLCCIVLVVGVYFFGQNIPLVSGFFPSPTPSGLYYTNPSAGISLTYPAAWQYSESGDASSGYLLIFASSAEILNSASNAPQSGAALAVLTNVMAVGDLPFPADASSMVQVLDYIATQYFTNIGQGQDQRTFALSGFPAASSVYTMTNDSGDPSTSYLITVLRNEEILVFFGVCPQTEWTQYQPTFDSIVNSTTIVAP
jgi:hypothetical protein